MALESTAVKRTANPNRENVENGRYGTMGRKWGAIAPKIQSWNHSSATDRTAQEKAQTARDSTRRRAHQLIRELIRTPSCFLKTQLDACG